MNGNHCNGHKSYEESVKVGSSFSYSLWPSLSEPYSKRNSTEAKQKANARGFSAFDISELRKKPDFFKKLIDTAIQIEKKQSAGQTYEISFSINYNTKFGESVVVTGDPHFLGNWDPRKGLELDWTPGNIWKASILLGEGVVEDFEYKYVCTSKEQICWEAGNNRVFKVAEGIKKNSHYSFCKDDVWQAANF